MSADLVSRPAWQTEELAEAWIDEEEFQESVDGIQNSIRRYAHRGHSSQIRTQSFTGVAIAPLAMDLSGVICRRERVSTITDRNCNSDARH